LDSPEFEIFINQNLESCEIGHTPLVLKKLQKVLNMVSLFTEKARIVEYLLYLSDMLPFFSIKVTYVVMFD